MTGVQIVFLILSMLILAAVFVIKSKKHANDNRINRRRGRHPRD